MAEIQLHGKWAARWPVAHVDDSQVRLVERYSWTILYNPVGTRNTGGSGRYTRRTPRGPYARTDIDGRHVYMHRLVTGFQWSVVDHKDGNGLNNCLDNLRDGARKNPANKCSVPGSSSKYLGVHWLKRAGKWAAAITHRGRRHYLGSFTLEVEAALAYDRAAQELHGDYARLNFPRKRLELAA